MFKIQVTQFYHAWRTVFLDVRADDVESALEKVASGEVDLPELSDPGWSTSWDLQNEDYEIAGRR